MELAFAVDSPDMEFDTILESATHGGWHSPVHDSLEALAMIRGPILISFLAKEAINCPTGFVKKARDKVFCQDCCSMNSQLKRWEIGTLSASFAR